MDKVIGIIPEVFYDFIGRVIPGSLFIVFFSFISTFDSNPDKLSLKLFFEHTTTLTQKENPLSIL